MAYGHYGRGYSYESPTPSDVDSGDIDKLIETLHIAIDNGKLRDLKSSLSKLKLSINPSYPLYTGEIATFSAYIYAVKSGNKKSVDSIFKAMIKKNFTYDGLPILTMIINFPKSDFKILLKDYFLNKDTKFNLEGSETLREMFKLYPTETEKMIKGGRLNKYTKGEARTESAMIVITNCTEFDTIIITLTTFFDLSYAQQYGMHENKLVALRDALSEQPISMVKQVLKEFFYIIYIKDIPVEMFIQDVQNKLLDSQAIENYTILQFRKSNLGLLEILSQIDNIELRTNMVTTNDEISNFVAENRPELLPDSVRDIFLF